MGKHPIGGMRSMIVPNRKADMRLIDANKFGMYIADVQLANRGWKDEICDFLDDVMVALDEQPTVDAVEVVRCKDCRHWDSETGWCYKHSRFYNGDMLWDMFDDDDFCSFGERRTDGNS